MPKGKQVREMFANWTTKRENMEKAVNYQRVKNQYEEKRVLDYSNQIMIGT